jgi:glycosyltransferase involved in cell wall biosynthesis
LKKPLKILHIAPQNFAGMPMDFVNMHRSVGVESRLITIYKNTLDFQEDISIDLPINTSKLAKKWRDSKIDELKFYKPKNFLEATYFKFRDFKNRGKITSYIDNYKLYDYDIYHFDGGMDLFRDLRFAKELKLRGKKIVCCYFGSDLRTRGIFKDLDEMSDLNLTVEFDHLQLYKDLNYLYFPFDVNKYDYSINYNTKIKIIHSPTNRIFKGTNKITKVIEELKKEKDFDFLLVENTEREKLLKLKKECNLAIDQVGGELGGTGYGKNSIENLVMGLPTITEFSNDYLKIIPENPFITCNIDTLKETLLKIIETPETLKEHSEKGRKWVEKYHSFESVNNKLMDLYKMKGMINN